MSDTKSGLVLLAVSPDRAQPSTVTSPQKVVAMGIMLPQSSWLQWFFIAILVGVVTIPPHLAAPACDLPVGMGNVDPAKPVDEGDLLGFGLRF